MAQEDPQYLTEKALHDPVLVKLSDVASEVAGIGFAILYPHANGWEEAAPGGPASKPDFCRLIQSSKGGAKHCRMCHVLMSVTACSDGPLEHRCHAGVCVLLTPVSKPGEEVIAVFSTCIFTEGARVDAWKVTRSRGKTLGIDLRRLKKAYTRLPELTAAQLPALRAIMETVGEAVKGIRTRLLLQRTLLELRGRTDTRTPVRSAVEQELRSAASVHPRKAHSASGTRKRKVPIIIEVVTNLVSRKPSMPFAVSEVAAAARMTPNHFSTIFRRHTKQNFSEFLTEKRIALAKDLLCDLTLNICEVAVKSGYDDPGYFARLFKKETGKTPRAWRKTLRLK